MKIISGGQTGVDRAALDAALSLGVPCGGWCPAGRLDENGIIPAHYPVQELPGGGYPERTARNVSEADGTVIIHPGSLHGGTKATADFCTESESPALLIDASRTSPSQSERNNSHEFVQTNQIAILNVAGPRASEWPQGYDFAHENADGISRLELQTAERGRNFPLSFPRITKNTNCRRPCASCAPPPMPRGKPTK